MKTRFLFSALCVLVWALPAAGKRCDDLLEVLANEEPFHVSYLDKTAYTPELAEEIAKGEAAAVSFDLAREMKRLGFNLARHRLTREKIEAVIVAVLTRAMQAGGLDGEAPLAWWIHFEWHQIVITAIDGGLHPVDPFEDFPADERWNDIQGWDLPYSYTYSDGRGGRLSIAVPLE